MPLCACPALRTTAMREYPVDLSSSLGVHFVRTFVCLQPYPRHCYSKVKPLHVVPLSFVQFPRCTMDVARSPLRATAARWNPTDPLSPFDLSVVQRPSSVHTSSHHRCEVIPRRSSTARATFPECGVHAPPSLCYLPCCPTSGNCGHLYMRLVAHMPASRDVEAAASHWAYTVSPCSAATWAKLVATTLQWIVLPECRSDSIMSMRAGVAAEDEVTS